MSHCGTLLRPMAVRTAPRVSPSGLARARKLACGLVALSLAAGCEPPDSTSSTSSSGSGGSSTGGSGGVAGSGGCLITPQPTFGLRVLAADGGPVPPDTTIEITWSAGNEPPFHLDDETTWGTLETSNIVCNVDPNVPPPIDLAVLECALWTSSPTQVRVSAKYFLTKKHTYAAEPGDACDPQPTPIEIELVADDSP